MKILKFLMITLFATVILGNSANALDLKKTTINGESFGSQLGSAFAIGDLNGDGIEDLIASSPFASTSMMEWNGEISIFFGSETLTSQDSVFGTIKPNVNIYGAKSGDQLGMSVDTGDINNDGIDDLLIGSYNGYFNTKRVGKVYVIFGKSIWKNNSINISDLNSELRISDITFVGNTVDGYFGTSVLLADINNDGNNDVLIGEPTTNNVWIYFGPFSSRVFGNHIVDTVEANMILTGNTVGEKFGSHLAAGDINGDKKTDLLVSAYRADKETGKVYVFDDLNFAGDKNVTAQYAINGSSENDWFGFYFNVDDVNNDGFDEIAISSFPYLTDTKRGMVKVLWGGENWKDNLKSSKYSDKQGGDLMGSFVGFADLNNDNVSDLIVGAPGVDYPTSSAAGNVYVSYGPNFNVTNKTFYGENSDDWFGYRLTNLDLNNDNFMDLVVGARYADGNNGVNHGKVYVFWGDESGINYEEKKSEESINVVDQVSRGEFIGHVIDSFNIREREKEYIQNCYDYRDFCFFEFLSKTSFENVKLYPELLLYPDVNSNHKNYEDINIATMLGYVNGNMESKNTPFYPDAPITRIQALKVILGAQELVSFKYKFEIADILEQISYFTDIDPNKAHMWWYPRYVNFAVDNGIISGEKNFRPDDFISKSELKELIDNTLLFVENQNEET